MSIYSDPMSEGEMGFHMYGFMISILLSITFSYYVASAIGHDNLGAMIGLTLGFVFWYVFAIAFNLVADHFFARCNADQ